MKHFFCLRSSRSHTLANLVCWTLIIMCALNWLAPQAGARSRSWTHNSSQLWSDPNNWSPIGVPQTGDDLIFADQVTVAGPDSMINDLIGLSVHSLAFSIDSHNIFITPDWNLNGNTLTITGLIATDTTSDVEHVYINCGLILGADAQVVNDYSSSTSGNEMHLTGPIDLNGHTLTLIIVEETTLEISGVISGTGDVIAIGDEFEIGGTGTIVISGTENNTFHGTMTVSSRSYPDTGLAVGNVLLSKLSAVAVPERLRVEAGSVVTLGQPEQIADNATVDIVGTVVGINNSELQQFPSTFHLNGYDETIGNLCLTNDATDTNAVVLDTGGGILTLNGELTGRSDNNQATPAVKGLFNLATDSHVFTTLGSAYAGLDMQAQITGPGGFIKDGTSALLLEAANTFFGDILIDDGILDVRNNNALGDVSGDTSIYGGTLTLRNVAIGAEKLNAEGNGIMGDLPGSVLTSIGTCSWAGQVVLDTNLVIFGDMTFWPDDIPGTGGIGFLGAGLRSLMDHSATPIPAYHWCAVHCLSLTNHLASTPTLGS